MKANGKPLKRGYQRQAHRRVAERIIVRSAIAFTRWGRSFGLTRQQAAERLKLSPCTLANWEQRWKENHLAIIEKGRPPNHANQEMRNQLIALFNLMGPHVGLPTLQALFPAVSRGELEELRQRYRFIHRRRNQYVIHALRWTKPGSVWAMDYSQPPLPIDGIYNRLLVIRDLASGKQLLSLPCEGEGARIVVDALKALFLENGIPLVIKADNGVFKAEEVKALAREHNILLLFSPEYTPRYNGACEAGIGSIKTRAHHESARNDRPGRWSCDDIEAARCQANDTARPEGPHAPTPSERWSMRETIPQSEREKFIEAYRVYEKQQRVERGCLPMSELGHRDQAALDRVAISRALVDRSFLVFRRRRIPLPFSSKKVTSIS